MQRGNVVYFITGASLGKAGGFLVLPHCCRTPLDFPCFCPGDLVGGGVAEESKANRRA